MLKKNLLCLFTVALMINNVSAQLTILGSSTPLTLPLDTGTIYLTDYFSSVSAIDSLGKVKGLSLTLSADKQTAKITVNPAELAFLSSLTVYSQKGNAHLLLRKSAKQNFTYSFDAKGAEYKSVQIAGDINGWTPAKTPLTLKNGKWEFTAPMNPGKYAYQLVIDGKWMLDPDNAVKTSNGSGGYNSVMQVSFGDDSKAPILFTKSAESNAINIGAENLVSSYFVFYNNDLLSESAVNRNAAGIKISIPKFAFSAPSATIRVFAFNQFGISNDLNIPLQNGKIVTNATNLKRDDYHAATLYFMMVDRFNDGDKSINKPVIDERVDPKANYQGGDLKGITAKIKDGYFKNLGINTIWVSPIVQNPQGAYQEYPKPRRWFSGYHGYWPVYTTKVDNRFGDDAALMELVKTAHENNMNVLMDFVSNHIHEENPLYKSHPEWFSSMYLKDSTVNIRIWDEQRLTTWFDTFMPDIDYTKPAAVEAFSDSALYWMEKFDLDGFRHDATKHVSEVFWRALTKKMKERVVAKGSKNIYQIGETFGTRELIGSYIGSGMMDAQFDFNLYFDARPVFAGSEESFDKVAASMKETMQYYGSHSLMGNITGNHDMPRFLYYAGGAEKKGEDEKEAGWSRNIKVDDPKGYARLKMLNAFIMSIPGIPIIYYGDEIGMPGAGDPDNRRMMQFSNLKPEEAAVKITTEKLVNLRRSSMPLIYGDTRILKADKDQMVFLRQYFNQTAVVVFNRSNLPSTFEIKLPDYAKTEGLKSNFGNTFKIDGNTIKITIAPLSFEILTQ
jgi:cyclomaltodextrinase / maltogenic alpha-amylase / neopullulanase